MNKNKKNIIILFSITALIAVIFATIYIINKNSNSDSVNNFNDNVINSQVSLPDLEEIDKNQFPLLYDFVNSSLGFAYSKNSFTDYGFFYAILRKNNDKNHIFIEYYDYGEKLIFPILGRKPEQIELNKSEQEIMDDWISKIDNQRIIKEGDYTLYIISLYNDFKDKNENYKFNFCDSVGRWSGLDLTKYKKVEYGQMYHFIYDNGYGWPYEWVSKSPFDKTLLDAGFDITDNFWKKYNIESYKVYHKKNNKNENLKVLVKQLDMFFIEKENLYLKEYQLKQYLEANDWEE